MDNGFNDLGITPPILKAIEEMGFETPTEVQSRAIPHILNHEDLIVMSKTGSGKTAVFGVSMLQMTDPGAAGPQGLILTPTRELAVQIDSDLKQMSKYLQHKTTAVYGQHNMNTEIQALNNGISFITGTPGRVFDHIRHGTLVTKHIRFLVLDEADRMLDMGFFDQVVRIIKTIPKDRVTLLFSATMPVEIRRICREYMKQPVTIEIESQAMTVDTVDQVYYRVERNEKRMQLNRLLLVERPESCLIFCNTRIAVDQVQDFLARKGYACQALHGEIPQAKRLKTIQQFKQGVFHLLVATDVAARGIQIDDLSLVINYDVPNEKDNYVHRVGRTARAGKTGRAITLVTSEDIMSLYEIEEHIGARITESELPSEADYNEHRAEAEKWIQANSLKSRPPRTASEPNLEEVQKKRTRTGPPQQYGKHRDRPAEVNTDQKMDRIKRGMYSAGQTKPVNPAGQTKPVNPAEQAKPVRSAAQTKPVGSVTHVKPARPAEQTKPVGSITHVKPARPAGQVKSVNTTSKPVMPHSTQADPVHARQSNQTVQSQDSAAKKPFLRRILQRIFGK